ncbi:MAG: hemerythrin domain-containing protein [Chitinophagaceae bacterium]|nr:MAG: hemerythrin domain-containing protein [Chitinophagaceae bacterium]
MKRHTSLAPLSRQHHHALLLAQLLKTAAPDYKGMPNTPAGKAAYAVEFYKSDLLPHFAAEEAVFEKIMHLDNGLQVMLKEIVAEHAILRHLFEGMVANARDVAYQNEVGMLLEKHIRREERELFPLIERIADEATLASLATILHH